MIKIQKTAKIVTGETHPGDWEEVIGGGSIKVKINTSFYGFSKTPVYVTALHGNSELKHVLASGANSITNATPNSFEIYITYSDPEIARELTSDFAKEFDFHIKWIAIED